MDIGDAQGFGMTTLAGVGVTAAVDLWEIENDPLCVARVGGLLLAQSSDLGDAAMEILLFQLLWGNTTGGSGGASCESFVTGFPYSVGNPVDGFSALLTTPASGGSAFPISGIHGWNVLQPLDLWYPSGLEPHLYPADGSTEVNVVRLLAAPADSLTMTTSLFVRAGSFQF